MLDLYMVNRLIDLWLAEDIGHGDITTLTMIAADSQGAFAMNARQPLSLAGIEVAAACFRRYDPSLAIDVAAADGDRIPAKAILLKVVGNARSVLTVERTALIPPTSKITPSVSPRLAREAGRSETRSQHLAICCRQSVASARRNHRLC